MKKLFLILSLCLFVNTFACGEDPTHSCGNCDEQTVTATKGERFYEVFDEVKEMLDVIINSEDFSRSEKDAIREVMKAKIKFLESIMNMAKWERGGFNGPTGSVKCALCNGTGLYNGKFCTACDHDGWAWSNDDPGLEKKCGLCSGKGTWTPPSGIPEVCPGCDGTGWANAAPNGPHSKEQLKSIIGRTKQ